MAIGRALSILVASGEVVRRGALSDAIFFDERAYRDQNQDVAASVDAGAVKSFYDHYVRYGKWEGRRFALRRWGLPEPTAARAFAAVARLEMELDALACALVPGEISHRLRSAAGARLVKPLGPWKHRLDRGPWRAALPASAREGGFYMVHARVAPVRAPLAFRVASGESSTEAAMFCQPARTTRRMIRIPPGAQAIEIELLDRRLRTQPLRVRLRRVPEEVVEARMLRRLRHHDARSRGLSEAEIRARFAAEARDEPVRERMWRAYEGTFPRPVARANHADWIERVEAPTQAALDREADARIAALPGRPRISVILPVYDPAEWHLRECLASIAAQSYPDWELCIADDGSRPEIRQLLAELDDPRIRLTLRAENGHICRASNDALALATGAWVAFVDHDDLLPRHAFLLVAEAIAAHPEAMVVYGDEDKIDLSGQRTEPHFKPRFDPDLLLGQNYLGHLFVARTALVRAAGGFRPGFEGSQDHDLALRLAEGVHPGAVVHVPHVLYHWRMSERSTAASASAKPYSAEAGIRAVREALARRGEVGEVDHAEVPHCYRVQRGLPRQPPAVSVVIPTRDAVDLLSACVDSLLAHTDYPDVEVIVIDNGSRDPRTKRYLERGGMRVIRDDRPFNFSALNNRAVAEARGEVVVLLNNDVEIVEGTWLSRLVAEAARPDVGAVGARLLFPDGTIQHAGVLIGLHGLAGHPYRHMSGSFVGYHGRLCVTHTVSAVTAACLAVRRDLYREIGGFDERLAVAFNDVDFCLRLREAGYRNLLVPSAVLVHHESATRGLDQDGAKRKRFLAEVATMRQRWGALLDGDPCYSPHLSLDHDDYSIRLPR
jgi:O-antigen biosynthesis protein